MDIGPENPIHFEAVMIGILVMAFYGFGLALMYVLSWMGDRILRPVIAYSLTTAGAIAYVLPSGQWLIVAVLLLLGAGCIALHVFAVIGRRIPPLPEEEVGAEWDEDDDEPDSR